MRREEVLQRLGFNVPQIKKKRVIVHSDIAAEADDYFSVAHHLMTPSEDVVGIIAANFEWRFRTIPHPQMLAQRLTSMEKSYAAHVLFDSPMKIWQIPVNAYVGMNLSFTELFSKVRPCGRVGELLTEVMLSVNEFYGAVPARMDFPHGEVWSLGDQPTVSVLLENASGRDCHVERAPHINEDMTYAPNPQGKEILVFDGIDRRLTMEDFFLKLQLCYGSASSVLP